MRKTATRRASRTGTTAKERAVAALAKLPADATLEDAIERLVFLAKIEHGLAQVDRGKGIRHREATRRLLR
jgi:hypothetical protein